MGTGSQVYSFPRAFPSSNDVPILLLNQPIVVNYLRRFSSTFKKITRSRVFRASKYSKICATIGNLTLLTQKAALFSVLKEVTESSSLSFHLLPRPSHLSSISPEHNMHIHAAILTNCQYLKLILLRLTLAAIETFDEFSLFPNNYLIAMLVLATESGIKICMLPLINSFSPTNENLALLKGSFIPLLDVSQSRI